MKAKSFMDAVRCVRCGEPLLDDSAREPIRVTISLTPDEIEGLAFNAPEQNLRARFVCALGLIDPDREKRVISELTKTGLL